MFLIATAYGARLTDEAVLAVRDEVVPLVEGAAGRSFDRVPEVSVVPTERFAQVLGAERATIVAHALPGSSEDELRAVAAMSRWFAPSVVAKYAIFEDKVYLTLDGLDRVAERLGGDTDRRELLACLLSHELTHALQARTGLYERLTLGGDLEALAAANAIGEGHAVAIQEQVCAPALREPLRKFLGVEEEGTTPYALGHSFLATQPDAWAVITRPPIDTAALLFPERYAPDAVAPVFPAWDALDAAVRALAGDAASRPAHVRTGAATLLSRVEDDAGVRAALGQLEWAFVASSADAPGAVSAEVAAFRTEADAASYVAAVRSAVTGPRPALAMPLYVDEVLPVAGVPADRGFDVTVTYRPTTTGAPSLRVQSVVMAVGRRVVTVTLTNRKVPAKRAGPVLADLRARLAE